jgi:ring-1,2-phenylacetyl-CoA epoxidase subunit PaaC
VSNSANGIPTDALRVLLLALADDELVLGHRDSEWTGYAPLLEEDIAFSNIAQDELGHSLVWFGLYENLTGKSPDAMAFERKWTEYTCCRFVTYPKGDFAYSILRQYLFDEAEQVRLKAFARSTYAPLKDASAKILREEAYHLMHSQGLVERLGDATEESHRRMQAATDVAFPQALGMFERLEREDELVAAGVCPASDGLQQEWLMRVVPMMRGAGLALPVQEQSGSYLIQATPDIGGRTKKHTEHLKQLINDLQAVYQIAPGAKW